jgi:ATP-dependent Lon protease
MSETKQARDKGGKEIYPVLPAARHRRLSYMIVPLFVGREKSINALEEVMRADKQDPAGGAEECRRRRSAPDAIYQMGTLGLGPAAPQAARRHRQGAGRGHRARQGRALHRQPRLLRGRGRARRRKPGRQGRDRGALPFGRLPVRELRQAQQEISPEVLGTISQIEDYSKLADLIASHLAIKIADKQDILEITMVSGRLERVYTLMESEISVLQVEKKIRSRVKRQMEKTQREYYLNEQMKAIQKELGDGDERDDIQEFEEKIENTKLSKEARDKALAELKKLKQMSPMSAEATVVRNYLDWLLSIPWGIKGKVKKDLNEAQEVSTRSITAW